MYSLYQVATRLGNKIIENAALSLAIENLLDALDASFCTEDDVARGKDCGIYSPTNVISISYGASEIFYPESQQKRQCLEFLKQSLQGVTFVIASGDYGVSERPGYNPRTNSYSNGCIIPGNYNASTGQGHEFWSGTRLNGTVFNPIYPQNCPYVSVFGSKLCP